MKTSRKESKAEQRDWEGVVGQGAGNAIGVVREHCSEKGTWLRLEGYEEPGLQSSWGRVFQVEGTASIKASRWEQVRCV